MALDQQSNFIKTPGKPSLTQRITAAVVFLAISGLFYFLYLGAVGKIDMPRIIGICEFKRTYGLPCVSCWMTTSAMAFVRGHILEAFYIQPAGAIICCGLVCVAVFSLLIALFAVNFRFLHRPLSRRFIRYFVISMLIILAAGWAVTIARAIAQGRIS
jgi:Protein of unknown function (DUF2752)